MRMVRLAFCIVVLIGAHAQAKGRAANVSIDFNTQYAESLLKIACSNEAFDEDLFRDSKLLKAQIAHHERFGERFSYENFIDGLRQISQCKSPSPDPFRFSALVERREEIEDALSILQAHQTKLARDVGKMLVPYVPEGMGFTGSVVMAAASFSCGGFAEGGDFFIDLQCVSGEIEQEIDAVQYLSAHETYHAIQNQFVPTPSKSEVEQVTNADEAREFIFHQLILEGTASYVADFRKVEGTGRYSTFSRNLAKSNYHRLDSNFLLFDYLIDSLGIGGQAPSQRAQDVYDLGFGGQFEELFYYVGAQMAAEIDADFGSSALVCIMQLPSENFVLAYGRAIEIGERLPDSHSLRPATYDAARAVAAKRSVAARLGDCI